MTDKGSDRRPPGEALEAGSGGQGPGQAGAAAGQATSGVTDMQSLIGRQLRAVYDDIAKQPVPDRFIELMRQLDRQPASR